MKFVFSIITYMKEIYSPFRSRHKAYQEYDKKFLVCKNTQMYQLNMQDTCHLLKDYECPELP